MKTMTVFHCHCGRSKLPNNAHFTSFNYNHTMPTRMPSTSDPDLNLNLTALCREGWLTQALHILLTKHNPSVHFNTYFQLLQSCISKKALSEGKRIHSHINQRDFKFSTHKQLQNTLIRLYDMCGCLVEARQVFDKMTERDVFSWNIIMTAYKRHEHPQEALTLFHQMQPTGVQPDRFTFATILPACTKIGALNQGMDIHQSIMSEGLLSDDVVASALLDMYAKCGSINKARELFDKMPQKDTVLWTAMIAGYAQNGFVEMALAGFKQMQLSGLKPDSTTFASVLPACAKIGFLEWGVDIHRSILESGFLSNVVVASALVDMYAKCGSIQKAHELFAKIPERNVVSWNAMIAGYTQNGFFEKAFEAFKQMQFSGVKPDSTTFAGVLRSCGKMGALKQGMDIHQCIMESGLLSDVVVASALVDMYAKCGRIHKVRELFANMPQRDVVSWNVMISGYAQNGFAENAVEAFKQMQLSGVKPDSTTFASILQVCAKMGALEQGIDIHQSIMESNFLSDVVVATALIDMYAKCGSTHKACELFDKMPQRDAVLWTVMIAGYAQSGFAEKALETFKRMQLSGVKPDSTTFVSVLPACAKIGALKQGIDIHRNIMESGFLSNVEVSCALVDMYAKCGSLHKAHELFDKMPQRDVVSWNAMIAGYAQNGFVEKAVEAFKQMQLSGVKPDSTTFASILPACAKMGSLEHGMGIHQSVMESNFLSDVVLATALVDMYAKCGSIHKASELFDEMPERDVVLWNTMIAGYAQNGFVEKAVETFKQMQLSSIKPDSTTFASVLPAYAKMGALEQGMDIHQRIIESDFLSNVVVSSALVDLYAKCGSIHKARELFDKMPQRDVISWNAMIAGYAQNGLCMDALKHFELMKHSGTYPDHVSCTSVLLAYSHAGLVDEGCKYFNGTSASYCIMLTIDHYVCMVDLLGRAGYLEETLNFIIKMPIKPVVVLWMCLLGACRTHKNIGLGLFTATLLFELEPQNAATYVLLSNIYAEVGRWGEVQMVRRLMNERGIKKIPGCSWIEGHEMVHTFRVGDRSHPQTQQIYAKLEKLSWEMKAAGYFPDSKHVLIDVDSEEKELFLCHHSEKLAIAFGLLNTPSGTTIRVVKNLRVCVDCHTATKFISKIVAREIVVRDANRFHHFKQGRCSCGDYW